MRTKGLSTLIALLVIASMMLVACGGAAEPTPAPTPVPTEAPAAEEPTAAPAATEVPATDVPAATEVPATDVPEPTPTVDPLTAIDPTLLPGSPDQERGWTTNLPPVPAGLPLAEPITIWTYAKVQDPKYMGGDSLTDNPWSRMIEALLGIKFDYKFTTSSSEEEQQKWQLAMASGDIPDVADQVQPATFQQLYEAGLLEDITDAYEQYASPEIKALLSDPKMWTAVTRDGRKYGLPIIESKSNNDMLLWIRQDWLDEVGMEAPTTIEELEAVAKAFVDAKLGGENTCGINASNALTSWLNDLSGVTGAYGAVSGFWVEKDGQLVASETQPEMKEALTLLNKWYEMGILRQDFYTVDQGGATGAIANNECGIFFGPFWVPNWPIPDSIANSNGEAKWTFVQTPMGPGGTAGRAGNTGITNMATVFRKDFKHIPEVFAYINWTHQLYDTAETRMHGWDGFNYQWTADNKVEPTEINAIDWFAWTPLRLATGLDNEGFLRESALIQSWSELPADQLDAYIEFRLQDPAGNAKQIRDAYTLVATTAETGAIFNEFTGQPGEAMNTYSGDLNTLRDSVLFAIITGERPVDDFDQFVIDWLAAGGQAVTDEVNAWYATTK